MTSKKTKIYDVDIRVVAIVGVEVAAEKFNEAYEKAVALKITDLIEFKGERNDSSVQIVNVGQNALWNVD